MGGKVKTNARVLSNPVKSARENGIRNTLATQFDPGEFFTKGVYGKTQAAEKARSRTAAATAKEEELARIRAGFNPVSPLAQFRPVIPTMAQGAEPRLFGNIQNGMMGMSGQNNGQAMGGNKGQAMGGGYLNKGQGPQYPPMNPNGNTGIVPPHMQQGGGQTPPILPPGSKWGGPQIHPRKPPQYGQQGGPIASADLFRQMANPSQQYGRMADQQWQQMAMQQQMQQQQPPGNTGIVPPAGGQTPPILPPGSPWGGSPPPRIDPQMLAMLQSGNKGQAPTTPGTLNKGQPQGPQYPPMNPNGNTGIVPPNMQRLGGGPQYPPNWRQQMPGRSAPGRFNAGQTPPIMPPEMMARLYGRREDQ